MRIAAAFLALALFAENVGAESGIGISAKSDNGLLYFPIDVSPAFRIEPHLRYSSDDQNSVDTVPPTAVPEGQTRETLEAGIGLFAVTSSKESFRVYYGARMGYLYIHTDLRIDNGPIVIRDSDTSDGYRIAPTLGFEYLFNTRFTLGGEVAYFYEHLESDSRFGSGTSTLKDERNGTETFLILRYFF
jgi:hypothetical protein